MYMSPRLLLQIPTELVGNTGGFPYFCSVIHIIIHMNQALAHKICCCCCCTQPPVILVEDDLV